MMILLPVCATLWRGHKYEKFNYNVFFSKTKYSPNINYNINDYCSVIYINIFMVSDFIYTIYEKHLHRRT